MSYQDFYLTFEDEAAAQAVLYTTTPAVLDEEGNVTQEAYTTPNYINIDVLGVLYEQPPVDAPEDYTPVALPGWHVNVRVMSDEDGEPLVQYAVNPRTPIRIWG